MEIHILRWMQNLADYCIPVRIRSLKTRLETERLPQMGKRIPTGEKDTWVQPNPENYERSPNYT